MYYHIIVVGSRPEKVGNRYTSLPNENVEFVTNTLGMVQDSDYAALYHGAAKGIDEVVETYAMEHNVAQKQFPAYWFDPTKPQNTNKAAGIFATEQMIRHALDNAYGKDDHQVILLGFYNTPEVKDDTVVTHAKGFAERKNITVRTFQLPVLKGTHPKVEDNQQVALTTSMPDPFAKA